MSNSISFPGLLTLLFIALKLMGYITWGWIWVVSPLWIALLIAITAIVVIATLMPDRMRR